MKYSALTWVKATIDESLKQTRQALEQFVEYPSDTAPLQQCVVWLHEIYGALKVLELQTAALLVQDVELTIKFLLAGKIENNESTYDVLMRALVQLPNYLDHLAIVQRDMPLALLPLLNELRALRKQPALAANSLFLPDFSVTLPHLKAVSLPDDKLKKYMQQMRAAYQKGLAILIKNPKQPQEGLKFIYGVTQRLQQATGTAPVSKVWWVTEGIVEALVQKGLEINKAIVNLLKQLDALINQAAQHGNAALRASPPKALLTNLLYFAGNAHSKGKQITAVKRIFQLDDYLPSERMLAAARLEFAGPDIELMKIVVTLLKDDFARVEENLDIFNRADNPSTTELSPLVALLRDMANTLGLLGLTIQRQSMLAQAALILDITEGRKPPELATLLQIANALLKISAAVDILAVQGVHAKQRLQQSPETEYSETPQFGIVLGVVVNEAKKELAQVIQPLVTFIDTGTQDDGLLEVPGCLKHVEGFLAVVSQKRAAQLLARCNQYINKVFIKEASVPAEDKLKALADVLISIELYLDTLAGNPMDADEILDVTEKRLEKLKSG
jgi:chemosensory pili system protein ChpA (sensor histidine kinase/response regulator)